jgi:hypothetical protein
MAMTAAPTRRPRLRFAILSTILLVAATVSLLILNLIATRAAVRFDVTATREHQLSPRTVSLLNRSEAAFEIVVAAPLRDPRTVDPRALQRVADVLDRFTRSSRNITVTLIDTGSTGGLAQYDSLLARLAERDEPKIERQRQVILGAAESAEQLAAWLDAFAQRLQAVPAAIPGDVPAAAGNRSYFEQRAGECISNARALRDIASRSRQILGPPMRSGDEILIPDTQQAAETLRRPLADLNTGLVTIHDNLRLFAEAEAMPAAARDLVRPLVREVAQNRDRTAVLRDSLERLERLDLLRVSSALQSGASAIVIGPPDVGLTAIDFTALFPPASVIDSTGGARADLGRNAEELIGTAIASLAHPIKPLVVLVHGQPRGFFDRQPFFRVLMQRLALRGIDVVTWEAAVNAEPPSLTRFNPAGNRPVVYICFNADSPSGSGGQGNTGPERAVRLGRVLQSIINDGQPLLLSLYPSTLPTFGENDPTTAFLREFGLEADTGRTILRERMTIEGRRVDAVQMVRAADVEHPIARAVRGLPTRFEWPVALRILSDSPGVIPLYTIEDRSSWGESQWLGYLQVPLAQHHQVPNPPSADSPRDDTSGRWTVAAAAQRWIPAQDRPQRLVVVGSNTWFVDWVLGDVSEVDGRVTPTNPGNAELLEASIYWLAGQDELIAQSPTARSAPLISDLSPGWLQALRLAAIAGLPGLVLAVGAAWRVLRG